MALLGWLYVLFAIAIFCAYIIRNKPISDAFITALLWGPLLVLWSVKFLAQKCEECGKDQSNG